MPTYKITVNNHNYNISSPKELTEKELIEASENISTGLTPEQSKKIAEMKSFEESIPGKVSNIVGAIPRFVTGEKLPSEEATSYYNRYNKENIDKKGLPEKISFKIGDIAKQAIKKGANTAPYVVGLPAGKLAGAATLGAVMGGSELVKGAIENKPLSENLINAGISGAAGTVTPLALESILKPLGTIAGQGIKKIAEPALKSDIGKAIYKKTSNLIEKLGIQRDRLALGLASEKELAKNISRKNIAKKEATIQGNAVVSTNKIENEINQDIYDLGLMSNEFINLGHKKLNQEYDKVLQKENPLTSVNLSTELNRGVELFNQIKGNNVLDKGGNIKAFLGELARDTTKTEDKSILANIAEEKSDFILKEAQILKKALYNYGKKIPEELQDFQSTFFDLSKNVSDKINEATGGAYSKLSNNWKTLLDQEKLANQTLGQIKPYLGFKLTRENTYKLKDEIKKIIDSGGEITDKVILEPFKKVKTVFSQINYLKQLGLNKYANDMEGKLLSTVDKYKELTNVNKTTMEMLKELKVQGDDLVSNIKSQQIKQIKERILNLKERGNIAKENIRKSNDIPVFLASVAVTGIESTIRSLPDTIADALVGVAITPLKLMVSAYAISKYYPELANIAYKGIKAYQNKIIKNIPLTKQLQNNPKARQLISVGVNKLANSMLNDIDGNKRMEDEYLK